MVEYLYNAIVVPRNFSSTINAYITDDNGELITEGCQFVITDGTGDIVIEVVNGTYDSELGVWSFVVNQEIATEPARFMYYITKGIQRLSFNEPLYIM